MINATLMFSVGCSLRRQRKALLFLQGCKTPSNIFASPVGPGVKVTGNPDLETELKLRDTGTVNVHQIVAAVQSNGEEVAFEAPSNEDSAVIHLLHVRRRRYEQRHCNPAILSSPLSTPIEARLAGQNDQELCLAMVFRKLETDDLPIKAKLSGSRNSLKNEVFRLALLREGALEEPDMGYHEELRSRLDMVLAFTEHDICDVSFPFSILEDLLETQTVSSCWPIFLWMEERTERLTVNMTSTKGKLHILLRMLNDFLRRLSKACKNTMLWKDIELPRRCFSINKNLLGNGVEKKDTKDADVEMANADEKNAATLEETEEGFQTFWSLQTAFSRPPLFARALPFESFRKAVDTVLPAISEATKKERAMMGSKVIGAGLKR
ncbi:hypothetical protein Clacol_006023 [Clathrus columnatus]|uniref:Uncharacterized protein n=1 Tax=Clathrus columnatus TaxID=1419009 RepID=A0AAV5AIL3_9AGAM|nr:hypothetical protein Clacol_006023 [Clathrus columnatus]